MESRSTNRMMIFLIVVLFGVAIFGFIRWLGFRQALSDNPWQNYKADLLAQAHTGVVDARKNWKDHRVAHYRLVIERTAPYYDPASAPRCQQDVEVKDETVVTTYQDTCSVSADSFALQSRGWQPPDPPFEATVGQFFATLERDTNEIYWTAQGIGCEFFTLEVRYDSQLGYPVELAYRLQMPPGQLGYPITADYFREGEATPGPGCLTIGPVDGPVIAVHLTPMQ